MKKKLAFFVPRDYYINNFHSPAKKSRTRI